MRRAELIDWIGRPIVCLAPNARSSAWAKCVIPLEYGWDDSNTWRRPRFITRTGARGVAVAVRYGATPRQYVWQPDVVPLSHLHPKDFDAWQCAEREAEQRAAEQRIAEHAERQRQQARLDELAEVLGGTAGPSYFGGAPQLTLTLEQAETLAAMLEERRSCC